MNKTVDWLRKYNLKMVLDPHSDRTYISIRSILNDLELLNGCINNDSFGTVEGLIDDMIIQINEKYGYKHVL